MYQIRIHGRGGQGAVTASYVLAHAAFIEGKYAQAFPMFGVERRGAPVTAFLRIDDKPIQLRTQIYEPDCVIVLDPTLIRTVDVSQGVKREMLINSKMPPSSFKFKVPVHTVDVSKLALEVLGRDITNTGMVAVFAKVTGMIKIESVEKAIDENFKGKIAESNKALVRKVYEQTKKA